MLKLIWKLMTISIWYWGTWALSYVTELRYAFIAAMVIQMAILFVTPVLARRSRSALVRAIFAPQFPTFRGPCAADWAALERSRERARAYDEFSVNPATGLPLTGPGGRDVGGNPFGFRE
jgi:hypothetical protein